MAGIPPRSGEGARNRTSRSRSKNKGDASRRKKTSKRRKSFSPRDLILAFFDRTGRRDLLMKSSDGSGIFNVLPNGVEYEDQNKKEEIILLVRQHPIVLIPQLFKVIIFAVLPIFIMAVIQWVDPALIVSAGKALVVIFLFWYLYILSIIFTSFLKWYFDVFLITNERIVDMDYDRFDKSTISGTPIETIEDVTHTPQGIWSSFFDFGNIVVQTAGAKQEFEIENVPRPRLVADILLDIRVHLGGSN